MTIFPYILEVYFAERFRFFSADSLMFVNFQDCALRLLVAGDGYGGGVGFLVVFAIYHHYVACWG